MLVFTGENGLTSDGLVAISTDLLVSIINSHGTCLCLVVLNGCKTFDAAQAILLQCPSVDHCVCWMTPVHSEAAAVFATALADMLAAERYPLAGNDSMASVSKAFHGAKAAVLEQVQPGRLRGVGPIGAPLYTFVDPENDATTYQECPCANRCQTCPRVQRGSNAAPLQTGAYACRRVPAAGGLAARSMRMPRQVKCRHLLRG